MQQNYLLIEASAITTRNRRPSPHATPACAPRRLAERDRLPRQRVDEAGASTSLSVLTGLRVHDRFLALGWETPILLSFADSAKKSSRPNAHNRRPAPAPL